MLKKIVIGIVALIVVLGIIGALADDGTEPPATASEPTVANVTASEPTPEATPTMEAITWVVANTGGDGVYIRKSPDMGDKLKVWPEGSLMLNVGYDQEVDGTTWKNVGDPEGNIGWIPAEYLATPTPVPQGVGAALDDVIAVINSANQAGGMKFFLSAEIVNGGKRLNVTVSDYWYALADYEKERFLDSVGDTYAVIAAGRGLRQPKPNEANFPQTSFLDTAGKEVGFKSTWETKVYR